MKTYSKPLRAAALLLAVLMLCSCSKKADEEDSYFTYAGGSDDTIAVPDAESSVSLDGYAVSSSSAEATMAGVEVLRQGGNAVDAAIAIGYTLGVTEPYSSGLGGGGCMLIYDPDTQESHFIDYRACAGSAKSVTDNVCIPGFVRGMQTALELYGTMDLSTLLEPAVSYAEKGFTANSNLISRLSYDWSLMDNSAFCVDGVRIEEGDKVVQKELAETLKSIQTEGSDYFYTGALAKEIAASCDLKQSDLEQYQVLTTDPISTTFNGYTLIGCPAPASSITTMQMLKMAEQVDMADPVKDTTTYLEQLQNITALAHSVRYKAVYDPSQYKYNPDKYLTDDYIASLLEQPSVRYDDNTEQYCTTHFCVMDANGMIVSATNTISDSWGSYICVGGFYLNNTAQDFNTGKSKNAYAPFKRSRTYSSPLIVLGDDGYELAIGTPGGNNIPRILFPILLDVLKYGTSPEDAINKSRILYRDDTLYVEDYEGAKSFVNPDQLPYNYVSNSSHIYFGCVSAVGYDAKDGCFSVCDYRRSTSKAVAVNAS